MKIKKTIALGLVCMLLSTGTAFAANHDFSFSFSNVTATQTTSSYAKSDNDQHWYLSLDTTNANTGVANTMSSANIFGCKMHRSSGTDSSTYHTFSNYVSSYPLDYTVSVASGDSMYLAGKKDNASTSSSTLRISGRFAP